MASTIFSEYVQTHTRKGEKICSAFSLCVQDMIAQFDIVCHVKIHEVTVAHVNFALSIVGNSSQGQERKHLSILSRGISALCARALPETTWSSFSYPLPKS